MPMGMRPFLVVVEPGRGSRAELRTFCERWCVEADAYEVASGARLDASDAATRAFVLATWADHGRASPGVRDVLPARRSDLAELVAEFDDEMARDLVASVAWRLASPLSLELRARVLFVAHNDVTCLSCGAAYRNGDLTELDVDGQLIHDPRSVDRIAHWGGGAKVVATIVERNQETRGAQYGRAADRAVARFLMLSSDMFAMERLVFAADDEDIDLAVAGGTEELLYSPNVVPDPFR